MRLMLSRVVEIKLAIHTDKTKRFIFARLNGTSLEI